MFRDILALMGAVRKLQDDVKRMATDIERLASEARPRVKAVPEWQVHRAEALRFAAAIARARARTAQETKNPGSAGLALQLLARELDGIAGQ